MKPKRHERSCPQTLPGSRLCVSAAKLAVFFLCLHVSVTVLPAQDARQIVEESQRRTHSSSLRYEGRLRVMDAGGRVSEKRWQFERIGSYGRSKAIIRFTFPPEVKGVALLVVNHPDRSSDQWMWTPAVGRDRRIALQDRSTRFFGTDFSFEDLEERDAGQYDYKLLGEESIDGAPCWRIQSRPKQSKSSQYSDSVIWIRKDHFVAAQVENFLKDRLARRLRYRKIEEIQGIWTARSLDMFDARRNSHTVLDLDKLQYNLPMQDADFTVQALRREQ